jgi:hypothetical protein
VYLLTQLGAFDALPLMETLFIAQGEVPKLFANDRDPPINDIEANGVIINRLFLFYAMHHLVNDYPRGKLSLQALKHLDEYQQATKAVPAFQEVSVPSWRARFEPWDYRLIILGRDLGMDKQPHIRMLEFPTQIPHLDDPFDGIQVPREVHDWFAKMQLFLMEAHPRTCKTEPKS